MPKLFEDDPLASAALAAIRTGDVEALRRLARENPGLATAVVERRTRDGRPPFAYPLIAAATDWPGHFPRVSTTIAELVALGANANARAAGRHRETPLHWAASTGDTEALDALLDAGAEIDAPGAVIAGGTPLDDAVAFAQWPTARRLVERGAATALWHAAALGLIDRLEAHFAAGMPPAPHPWTASGERDALEVAFWCACHGAQRAAAEYLLARGANPSWASSWDGLTPLDAARRSGDAALVEWLLSVGAA